MRKFFMIAGVMLACLACAGNAGARPPWLPKGATIPKETVSPDGRYGVMLPDDEVGVSAKLVEMKSGRVVAELDGDVWRELEARWSADGAVFCYITEGRYPEGYALKLRDGKVAWRIELIKRLRAEIRARTKAAAPDNYEVAEQENPGSNMSPGGFWMNVDIAKPKPGGASPLVCRVTLTSDVGGNPDKPPEGAVAASMDAAIGEDGTVSYSHFAVKRGPLVSYKLVTTNMGKGLLFPGMISKDGRYAVGWSMRPAREGVKPVDWSGWREFDPYKMLGRYCPWIDENPPDNGEYEDDGSRDQDKPYVPFDFAVDLHSGKAVELPSGDPFYLGKGGQYARGYGISVVWGDEGGGRRSALVANEVQSYTQNVWLAQMDEKGPRETDVTAQLRKAVNGILMERRPLAGSGDDYRVGYELHPRDKAGKELPARLAGGVVDIPFTAVYTSFADPESGVGGAVSVRMADGAVMKVASATPRLDPFETDAELKKADGELNDVYQALMKRLPPGEGAKLKEEQRAWIRTRNDDAEKAVQGTIYTTKDSYMRARVAALLKETRERTEELKNRIGK